MHKEAIFGVDIGTTGCRAVLYRVDGTILASHSIDYPLYTPESDWAEQDPDEIYQAFVTVVSKAMVQSCITAKDIAGVSFSSALHSLIPVDATGTPLYRMLTWADNRAQSYKEKVASGDDGKAIYSRTACPPHPMFPLYKILWFRYERPEMFQKIAKFIGIKEYIIHRLTGKYIIDKSIASGSGLYNNQTLSWDEQLLELTGLRQDQLSEVVPTTHIERQIDPQIAQSLGIAPDTPLIMGGGDGMMNCIGSGAINPGQLTLTIGTSGAVRVITTKPYNDPKGRTWCYNLSEDYWVLGGAITNGGIALRWAKEKFASTEQKVAERLGLDAYDILSRYAEQKPAGSDGLIMLPFFAGERAPYWNANARGVLFGLNLNHGKRHLVRATMEGICYRMYSILQALEEVSGQVTEIRVSGSFTRSRLWVQILADVFGRVITVPGEPEGAAYGAAVLGLYALGFLHDIKEVGNFINIKERYYPSTENHERYQQLFKIYERIYWNLQQEFEEIAKIQRTWKN
ncbi:gluconokinase [Anaerospora hongkongensis]|uniref:gluconokinase n=1 Tax=Anaerospora hongkongensis TaxID=244830 RepID=UPI002FD8B999